MEARRGISVAWSMLQLTFKALASLARNPEFGGVVVIGRTSRNLMLLKNLTGALQLSFARAASGLRNQLQCIQVSLSALRDVTMNRKRRDDCDSSSDDIGVNGEPTTKRAVCLAILTQFDRRMCFKEAAEQHNQRPGEVRCRYFVEGISDIPQRGLKTPPPSPARPPHPEALHPC